MKRIVLLGGGVAMIVVLVVLLLRGGVTTGFTQAAQEARSMVIAVPTPTPTPTPIPPTPTPTPVPLNPNDAYLLSVVRPLIGISREIAGWTAGIKDGSLALVPTFNAARTLADQIRGQMSMILQAAQPASPPYRCLARLAGGVDLEDSMALAAFLNNLATAVYGQSSLRGIEAVIGSEQHLLQVAQALEAVLARYVREIEGGERPAVVTAPAIFVLNPGGPGFLSYLCPGLVSGQR